MKLGDHVVLVDDDWQNSRNRKLRRVALERPELFPVRGIVYTVSNVLMHERVGLHIRLAELCGPQPNWAAHRFRKLNKLTPETFRLTKELIS